MIRAGRLCNAAAHKVGGSSQKGLDITEPFWIGRGTKPAETSRSFPLAYYLGRLLYRGCTVAARAPESDVERDSYFVDGLYWSLSKDFRERLPTSCTGHFLDYPCGWTFFFVKHSYHYLHMVEIIWYAAKY